jgi:hypothetical protein
MDLATLIRTWVWKHWLGNFGPKIPSSSGTGRWFYNNNPSHHPQMTSINNSLAMPWHGSGNTGWEIPFSSGTGRWFYSSNPSSHHPQMILFTYHNLGLATLIRVWLWQHWLPFSSGRGRWFYSSNPSHHPLPHRAGDTRQAFCNI